MQQADVYTDLETQTSFTTSNCRLHKKETTLNYRMKLHATIIPID